MCYFLCAVHCITWLNQYTILAKSRRLTQTAGATVLFGAEDLPLGQLHLLVAVSPKLTCRRFLRFFGESRLAGAGVRKKIGSRLLTSRTVPVKEPLRRHGFL